MTLLPEEQILATTFKGEEIPDIELEKVYDPEDIEGLNVIKEVGKPGEYPFTRGISPLGYHDQLWTMRVSTYSGLAEEVNARIKFLRRHGEVGLSLALDLPTKAGLDSDDPKAMEEVGRLGMAVDTLHDMECAFENIPLDETDVSFPISAPASILLAMYLALAEKRGVPLENLKGVIENDSLQEHISQGTSIFPPEDSIRLVGDVIEYCVKNTPKLKPVNVSFVWPSGMSRAEALSHMFLKAIVYLEEMLSRGYAVDDFTHMFSFQYAANDKLVESVAAIRATRKAWAKLMKNQFQAKKPESMMLKVEAYVDPKILKVEEELRFNITRVTCQGMPSILGGVQGLLLPAYDEVSGTPSELATRIAVRTHQVIAYELDDLINVVDPLGGSYFVEKLTSDVEKVITKIVEDGIVNKWVMTAIESGKYRQEPVERSIPKFNPDSYATQLDRLAKVKKERDGVAVNKALAQVRQAAKQKKNMIPHLVKAAKTYATMGEMVKALKG